MNWPLVFIVGWTPLAVIVCFLLYLGDRRREAEELAEYREELRDTFERVVREMVVEEREHQAKVKGAVWN